YGAVRSGAAITDDDGKFRMNPPIRADRDRRAIIEAVRNGTVDMIATDHAPHSLEEKSGGFQNSLNGIIGLETAFAVMNTLLCETGEIPFEKLVQLMSTNPASRFGLDGGHIIENGPADIVIIDRDAEWVIDKDRFKSKGRSCPFYGIKEKGQVAATICGGDIVYER
ncbi:MAG: amidohydrolase family protein, partial [Clostridia bacterium]|nr:amidohydrolase family protein [Clostridia bacterium]